MQSNDIIVLSDSWGHADPVTPLNGAATCYCPFSGKSSSTQHAALFTQAGAKQIAVELSILSACLIGSKNCQLFHQTYHLPPPFKPLLKFTSIKAL